MDQGLTYNERKEWAKMLYTEQRRSIKDVALEVAVDEATVRNWINEGGWNGIKRSLLTSKMAQLDHLYVMLETLHAKMRNADEVNLKDADLSLKYIAAINNLEPDTPVSNILDVADLFIRWLRRRDIEFTKLVTVQLDDFIKERSAILSPE